MPGLIFNIGGKLDSSYKDALYRAAQLAKQQQSRMTAIFTVAPTQLAVVNRALANLPAASLMRPRLEKMKAELTGLVGEAGAQAGGNFITRFLSRFQGHGAGGMGQLIHVFRATFDSIATGQPFWRVMLQQAPQAGQAIGSMIGTSMLKTLAGMAAGFASVAAIIAAPFLYLWRVNAIASRLSDNSMLDIKPEYIARANTLADSYRAIARAIREKTDAYLSATSAASRYTKIINDQFQAQAQLDELAKQREIDQAAGNAGRIAQIEAKYEQLKISRESQKLDAEKAAKEREMAGLSKEIAATQQKIGNIRYGSDQRYSKLIADLKKQNDADKELVAKSRQEPGFFGKLWRDLRVSAQSGGFAKGLATFNPNEVTRLSNDQLAAEAAAKKSRVEAAQRRIQEYQKLVNLEKVRTDAVKERDRLQSEAEKKSKRYAELSLEISAADAEKQRILNNMRAIAQAKAANQYWSATGALGRSNSGDLTANQRIGAFAMFQNLTIVDLTRTIANNSTVQTDLLRGIKDNLPGDVNGPFQ